MFNTRYPISVSDFYKDIINENILEQVYWISTEIETNKKIQIKSKYTKEDIIKTIINFEKDINRLFDIIKTAEFKLGINKEGKCFEIIDNSKDQEISNGISDYIPKNTNNEKKDLLNKKRCRNDNTNYIYHNNNENNIQEENKYIFNNNNENIINENIQPLNIESSFAINFSDLIEYVEEKRQKEINSLNDKFKEIKLGNKIQNIKPYPIYDLIMYNQKFNENKITLINDNNNKITLLKLKLPDYIIEDFDKIPKLLLIISGLSPEYHTIIREEIYNCIKNDNKYIQRFNTKCKFNISLNDIERIKFCGEYISPNLLYSFCKMYNVSLYYQVFISGKKRIIHLNHKCKEIIFLIMKDNQNKDNKYIQYDLGVNLTHGAQLPLEFKKKLVDLIKKNI